MTNNKPFQIQVPYNGKEVTATVLLEDIPMVLQAEVKFPDGYHNTFFYYDEAPEDNDFWVEQTLGVTQLSKDVGAAIDDYITNNKFWETQSKTPDQLGDDLNF